MITEGTPEYYRIPNSSATVAQTLLSYPSSHRPQDLWRLVTPNYRSASIWLQVKSGDNVDMIQITAHVDDYIFFGQLEENPNFFALLRYSF